MYLLDTHVIVWAISAPEKLSIQVREIIESKQTKASVVSFWELVLKKTKKSAPVLNPVEWWDRHITRAAFEVLPVRTQHIARLDSLPPLHRDPFDRMLIAQAGYEGLKIVTADEAIAKYTDTVW